MESRKRSSHATKTRIEKGGEVRKQLMADLRKKRLYDSYEVCELLGISLQSLRRAIALKKVKTVRLGRFLRIPAEEVERIIQGESALLTVAEAAELLNISAFTIRLLIKSGKIKAFRLANKGPWKIAKSDIERIAQEGITE